MSSGQRRSRTFSQQSKASQSAEHVVHELESLQVVSLDQTLERIISANPESRRVSELLPAYMDTAERLWKVLGGGCLETDALNIDQLRIFAECTGFDEEESPWADAYRGLCFDYDCDPEKGLGFEVGNFTIMGIF